MNHYEKLAVLAVRLLASIVFFLGAVGLVYAILVRISMKDWTAEFAHSFYVSIIYLSLSVLFFAAGKILAKLFCRGLGE